MTARHIHSNSRRWRRIAARAVAVQPWCSACYSTEDLTADHVHELHAAGDPWDPTNVEVLCRSCNGHKTTGSLVRVVPPWQSVHLLILRERWVERAGEGPERGEGRRSR